MDTSKQYIYTWSGFKATIQWSRIFNSWTWRVQSVNNEYVNFSSHIDVELDTLEEAEDDLFFAISEHIGSKPERQIKK